jgi:hypothetical protein
MQCLLKNETGTRLCYAKDEPVTGREVYQRAAEDGQQVGGQGRYPDQPGQEVHQHKIAGQGNQAVGGVKPPEPVEAHAGVRRPIAPGPPVVPPEVVQNRELDRNRGRGQIVQAETQQQREQAKLERKSDRADSVESEET